jgi:hypothetical protein
MLGRRSTLIGAMVQAIGLAIHNMVEYKSPASKTAHIKNMQIPRKKSREEVILPAGN